ncbi:MAG: serine/threonine protein kinase [Clostridia bacterium]|nr:serine/threonine protein kinase [Clostridia bacterium]
MNQNICLGCMETLAGSGVCPKCGFELKKYTPETHQLIPGTLLRERFIVGRVLGEGGFGITYVGWDTVLDLKVAIKEFYMSGYVNRNSTYSTEVVVNSGIYGETFVKNRDKFLGEAKVLARFYNEEGIVGVRDFFRENNTAYLVMDFLSGENLRAYIDREGRLSAEKALDIILPVIHSLKNVHSHNVIHRDISPDNIMLTDSGKVKLLDFGAARDISFSDIKSLSVILKPGYAPEEQYRSKGVQGPWTDIYAICATLYRCVTGTVPEESMNRLFDDKLLSPYELGSDCSKPMSDVIMKGLSVRHTDRYKSIEELLSAFESAKNKNSVLSTFVGISVEEVPEVIAEETAEEIVSVSDINTTLDEETVFTNTECHEGEKTVFAETEKTIEGETLSAETIDDNDGVTAFAETMVTELKEKDEATLYAESKSTTLIDTVLATPINEKSSTSMFKLSEAKPQGSSQKHEKKRKKTALVAVLILVPVLAIFGLLISKQGNSNGGNGDDKTPGLSSGATTASTTTEELTTKNSTSSATQSETSSTPPETTGEGEEVPLPVPFDGSTFIADGTTYSLPMKVSDFEADGWKLDDNSAHFWSYDEDVGTWWYGMLTIIRNSTSLNIHYVNTNNDKECAIRNCYVYKIENDRWFAEIENPDGVEISPDIITGKTSIKILDKFQSHEYVCINGDSFYDDWADYCFANKAASSVGFTSYCDLSFWKYDESLLECSVYNIDELLKAGEISLFIPEVTIDELKKNTDYKFPDIIVDDLTISLPSTLSFLVNQGCKFECPIPAVLFPRQSALIQIDTESAEVSLEFINPYDLPIAIENAIMSSYTIEGDVDTNRVKVFFDGAAPWGPINRDTDLTELSSYLYSIGVEHRLTWMGEPYGEIISTSSNGDYVSFTNSMNFCIRASWSLEDVSNWSNIVFSRFYYN